MCTKPNERSDVGIEEYKRERRGGGRVEWNLNTYVSQVSRLLFHVFHPHIPHSSLINFMVKNSWRENLRFD
jgi:hypothetical protein